MNTLLLVAVVGQWSWLDSVADPKPIPPTSAVATANNVVRSDDCCCPVGSCRCDSPCRCAALKAEVKPETKPVSPPAPSTPVVPKSADSSQRVRAIDDYGTTWEFDDKARLDDWITAINVGKKAREANAAKVQTQTQAPTQPPVQAPQYQAPSPQYGYSMPQAPMQGGYGYGGGFMMGGGGGACGPTR